jgi:hypothetical protein
MKLGSYVLFLQEQIKDITSAESGFPPCTFQLDGRTLGRRQQLTVYRTRRRAGPLRKLRVHRPQEFLCAGECALARAHTAGSYTSLVSTAAARAHTRDAHEPRAHRSCGPGLHDILLTRIASSVQWRCRLSESRQTLIGMEGSAGNQGAFCCCTYPRGLRTLVRKRHVAPG